MRLLDAVLFVGPEGVLSGSGLGKCPLYTFNPPSNNGTNYAYGRRASTTGDGTVTEAVSRYYGTHIFGQLCAGIGGKPTNWPGYLVKYDAGNSVCQATAAAGISSGAPSVTTAGTISVYNGAGTTSFAVPASGVWSTAPANVNFTTSGGYVYTLTANLGSNPSFTTQVPSNAAGSATRTEAKAVVGSPVVGTITYQVTDPSAHVIVDVTIAIDIGNLTAYAKYSPAT